MKEEIIKITITGIPDKCKGEKPKYIFFNDEWNRDSNI